MDSKKQYFAIAIGIMALVGIVQAATYDLKITTSADVDTALTTAATATHTTPEAIMQNELTTMLETKYSTAPVKSEFRAYATTILNKGSTTDIKTAIACLQPIADKFNSAAT